MSLSQADIAEIWTDLRHKLLGYLVSRLPTREDAEDVLQEVFLKMVEGRPPHTSVSGWVFGIARRAVADFYRAKARSGDHVSPEAADALVDPASEPENLADFPGEHDVHEEVISWIEPTLNHLPPKYRDALRMADLEGKTQQEVADALGLSLSGAKSRVQRARTLLGDLVTECCLVEFGNDGRAAAFTRKGRQD